MKSKLQIAIELTGAASILVGFVLGAHHLRVELPIICGAAAILIARYFVK